MDEYDKPFGFDRDNKNTFDSEEALKSRFGTGYKEYDFEVSTGGQPQQEMERKVQDLWRAVEKAGIKPKVSRTAKKSKKQDQVPQEAPENWMDTLKELKSHGLDVDAGQARHQMCPLCDHDDLGQVYADEIYEDRYIKRTNTSSCD